MRSSASACRSCARASRDDLRSPSTRAASRTRGTGSRERHLTNLLQNAAEAAGPAGLRPRHHQVRRRPVVIGVHDSGPGLSAKVRYAVEPTITFKKHGLDRPLDRQEPRAASARHHGRAGELKGAAFRVTLPPSPRRFRRRSRDAHTVTSSSSRRAEHRRSLRLILEGEGHVVRCASRRHSSRVERAGPAPICTSGRPPCRRQRHRTAAVVEAGDDGTPVVMISGHAPSAAVDATGGAFDFLEKPWHAIGCCSSPERPRALGSAAREPAFSRARWRGAQHDRIQPAFNSGRASDAGGTFRCPVLLSGERAQARNCSRTPPARARSLRAVRQGQLRGHSDGADRKRAVRPRERRFHRAAGLRRGKSSSRRGTIFLARSAISTRPRRPSCWHSAGRGVAAGGGEQTIRVSVRVILAPTAGWIARRGRASVRTFLSPECRADPAACAP